MRRAATIIAVTASLGLGLTANPTHAVEGDLLLTPDRVAHVNKAGTGVSWGVRFRCPEGEIYSLHLFMGQRDPVGYPDMATEDNAVPARLDDITGICTGSNQRVVRRMTVTETSRPNGQVTLIPMRRSDSTSAMAYLTVPSGSYALFCAAPNCASETGTLRIKIR
jgi:hypothetical protein